LLFDIAIGEGTARRVSEHLVADSDCRPHHDRLTEVPGLPVPAISRITANDSFAGRLVTNGFNDIRRPLGVPVCKENLG